MAANFVDTGQDLKVVLGSGQTQYGNGKPILVGDIVGVITALKRPGTGNPEGRTVFTNEASAAGDIAIVHIKGIWKLPKVAGNAWTQGQPLYWDATTRSITGTVATNILAGYAELAAASADTTGNVILKLG